MEVMASDIDGGEFGVVDGDAGVVGIGIELGVNREAGLVVVAAISWTMTWWLINGLPRQF